MIFQTVVAARLIFILGLINLVTAVLVLLTCRCVPGLRITGNLMQYAPYRRLFKYHCYYWWIFWLSVVVHAIFAIGFMGLPF
jgi:hypothetical protein